MRRPPSSRVVGLSKTMSGTGVVGSLAAWIGSTVFLWPTKRAVSAKAAPPVLWSEAEGLWAKYFAGWGGTERIAALVGAGVRRFTCTVGSQRRTAASVTTNIATWFTQRKP